MVNIIVLDDSVSYFTYPERLHTVYRYFWDEGIPVAIGITPALRGDVIAHQDPEKYDHGVDPHARGKQQPFNVSRNSTLCNYLNVMAEQRLVEICVRGYHGSVDEFNTDDDILLIQKIDEGRAELRSALPDAQIETFILPDQAYSQTALEIISEYDMHICGRRAGADPETPEPPITSLANDRKLFVFDTPLFGPYNNPDESLERFQKYLQQEEVVVLRQHYHHFYDDDALQTNALFDRWQTFVRGLLARDDLHFDTFMYI